MEIPEQGSRLPAPTRGELLVDYLDRLPTLQSEQQRFRLKLRVSLITLVFGSGLYSLGYALGYRPLLSLGVLGGIFALLVGARLPSTYLRLRRLARDLDETRSLLEATGGVPDSGAT